MSSGDTLLVWTALLNEPPSADYATFDLRNNRPCLDFDDGGSEEAIFSSVMPQAFTNGADIELHTEVTFTSATTGSGVLQVYFERGGSTLDLDTDDFGPNSSMGINVPPNSGGIAISSINITGASLNSVEKGSSIRIKLQRHKGIDGGVDNATGDLELYYIELREV